MGRDLKWWVVEMMDEMIFYDNLFEGEKEEVWGFEILI